MQVLKQISKPQHRPDDSQEERFLHGAACHGCLLIAETSCERRNEFLDRALVVNTVEAGGLHFFLMMSSDVYLTKNLTPNPFPTREGGQENKG